MKLYSDRAGKIIHVQSDYDCYVPNSLRDISINIDVEMIDLLAESNRLLGMLDGMASNIPNRDLFISMYVEKEACVSSQIEGTQASLSDVLQRNNPEKKKETEEIVNYVHALNYGINLMETFPLSIRFLKEIHKELLKGVRGEQKSPGELRHSQNWIGRSGCTLATATFVPPSVDKMTESLYDLEIYMNEETIIQPLIKIALIHYQFETIHPFLDGNGRLGRLLIIIWLKYNKILNYPLLYLSLYFKQNRTEYYSLLMDVRFKGRYEEWIKFFLRGIIEMSENSIETISKITKLKEEVNKKISNITVKNKNIYISVIDYLYKYPYFTSNDLIEQFNITRPTSLKIINELVNLNIIKSENDKRRYVTYVFKEYVDILENGTEI